MAKNTDTSKKKTKEDRIKSERNKLKKLFKEIPENQKKLCEKLIENAAFMAITLEDLQQTVNVEGAITKKKNGNGFVVTQEHPAQKSYNAMINRYTATIKQLIEILPEQAVDSKLLKFLND